MYVAVKGGQAAIENAHRLLDQKRRGHPDVPPLSLAQIAQQMPLAVARVMSEGSLYDRELAALAIKQSAGDLMEAIFLLRAYRTTLSRYCVSRPLQTESMQVERRISATYKDLPGGQLLGPTFDYTHRLLDFTLQAEGDLPLDMARGQMPTTVDKGQAAGHDVLDVAKGIDGTDADESAQSASQAHLADTAQVDAEQAGCVADTDEPVFPRVLGLLAQEGLIREETDSDAPIPDITREPLDFPSNRMQRLQALARGDEGFLLALGYSTQRGYGRNHPFAGEIRIGLTEIWLEPEELDFAVPAGDIEITECEMVNQFVGSKDELAQFTRGYGLAFGYNERKVMGMALVDRALRAAEYDEEITSPAQQEEFVLMHCDNVEAAGFVSHLKLPHYVDFQAELELIRKMRKQQAQGKRHAEQQATQATPAEQALTQKEKRA
ncbi:carbon-phosphorus lyase complex subunit PhnI [Advenella sp. S44]|uniref:carbon-phosphorus lyase complex subunit PhnI n=1 Tax=Advenella sp. S44 TaxID=1982755 RepID=UPI000C2ACA53|nr:carbon-phosphorus lyase complex subunit PhnI [Advenella sp. S44]PJX25442.1 carbon-phosphorus lyase complex subunit PhnI [Advenella sp. S44]